jgi:WhiB family redox-sensing transcriptional regulator
MADIRRLPLPRVEAWEWQLLGACRGSDNELFFHPENERGQARGRREAAAKAVCGRCRVLARCREHALTVGEPYGVWGGMSESEREKAQAPPPSDPLTRARARRPGVTGPTSPGSSGWG